MGASRSHAKLITDTNNDYAQGTHRFAPDLPRMLKIMDSYSKTAVTVPVPNQGSSFAQGGRARGRGDGRARGRGRGRGRGRLSHKEWEKDKICGRCGEVGHVATTCPNELPAKGKKKTSDDDRSRSSKSSRSSVKSNQKEINKIKTKLKTSFAQIKEARNKIEELEEEDLTDSDDDEDGNQFLMFGEHIYPDLDPEDLEESNSGNEDDDPGPFMLNASIWCGVQQVDYYPLQHYDAMGIVPPMFAVWQAKAADEPVYEEATTKEPMWYHYNHYIGHRDDNREDITSIVHGPFDATGMTLAEARIAVEARCARYESRIEEKLSQFRHLEKVYSPEGRARREFIDVCGPELFQGHLGYPSLKTIRKEHPELLLFQLPEWPAWTEEYKFQPDETSLPDDVDSDDDSEEPPPLLFGRKPGYADESSSSSEDESEDEDEDPSRHRRHEWNSISPVSPNWHAITRLKCSISPNATLDRPTFPPSRAPQVTLPTSQDSCLPKRSHPANVHPLFTTGVVMNQSSYPQPRPEIRLAPGQSVYGRHSLQP